jgi:type I restriction enzyme S subunit
MKSIAASHSLSEESPRNTDLPEGWATVTLAEIGRLHCGQSPATAHVNTIGIGTPYVTGPEQWNGKVLQVHKSTTDPRRVVPDGCVFITVKGAGVGTILPGVRAAIGRDVYAFEPQHEVAREFVMRALELTVAAIKEQAAGDIPGLSRDHLLTHVIGLPPRDEQKRIISAISMLVERVSTVTDRLAKLLTILKRFRQAVLGAACSGRLTADWRETKGTSPSARTQLDSIGNQRRVIWVGTQDGVRRRRKYPQPVEIDTDDLPEIPEGWSWVSADEVCAQITDGEHIQPKYQTSGFPMLTATHVRDGWVEFKDMGLISETDFQNCLKRCAPRKDDVLIVSVGATTGRGAIVTDCEPFAIVRSVLLLRPLIQPRFLLHWTQSSWCRTWISQASGASAQPHFYIHDARRMPIPFPPLEEQHEVVRRVEALFKLASAIERRVEAATLRAEGLTQAILTKAFRGELVPTEAELARREGRSYEPASELLARIRAERETSGGTSRSSRKAPPFRTPTARRSRRRK